MNSTSYSKIKVLQHMPRIPFKASIDLTYRCNNDCRHCWVRLDPRGPEKQKELTTAEIFDIVDQAKKLGTREWAISGGEPMLRPDFYDLFDYITRNSKVYSLNTNGTLITPKIAKLMQERKGMKMVALYGASKEVYEDVSRIPGSYNAAMRGFRLLKEAGAGFIVQVIPMKANHHEYDDMLNLAKELSPNYRIGAPWLYLSADGDEQKNQEIREQRLPAKVAVELDPPQAGANENGGHSSGVVYDDNIFQACIENRRDFYIDPYGQLTFCSFVREPSLMYDLRLGTVKEAWENFIPSLKDKFKGGQEYRQNCGTCEYRSDCRWCGVYAYLEHGRHSSKVEYLCQVAQENRKYKKDWATNHRRYFNVAGLTIQFESDLPINEDTFHDDLKKFMVDEPGEELIKIYHHFEIPHVDESSLGKIVKDEDPWTFYHHEKFGLSAVRNYKNEIFHFVAIRKDFSKVHIYHRSTEIYNLGQLHLLTYSLREVAVLGHKLIDLNACYFHCSSFIYKNKGFVFLGHSGAGKSTMIKLMREHVQILCDETNIIRRENDGYKVYGTWNHGELPDVTADNAPIAGIFVLNQDKVNALRPMRKIEAVAQLIARVFKTIYTEELWQKQLLFFEKLVEEVPFYELSFDRSGKVKEVLDSFLEDS